MSICRGKTKGPDVHAKLELQAHESDVGRSGYADPDCEADGANCRGSILCQMPSGLIVRERDIRSSDCEHGKESDSLTHSEVEIPASDDGDDQDG